MQRSPGNGDKLRIERGEQRTQLAENMPIRRDGITRDPSCLIIVCTQRADRIKARRIDAGFGACGSVRHGEIGLPQQQLIAAKDQCFRGRVFRCGDR